MAKPGGAPWAKKRMLVEADFPRGRHFEGSPAIIGGFGRGSLSAKIASKVFFIACVLPLLLCLPMDSAAFATVPPPVVSSKTLVPFSPWSGKVLLTFLRSWPTSSDGVKALTGSGFRRAGSCMSEGKLPVVLLIALRAGGAATFC